MRDHFKELSSHLDGLGRKHGLSKVFNDLVSMSVCSYHRVNIQSRCTEKDETNEKLYLSISKTYNRNELNTFAKAMGELTRAAHDHPYSDILGRYFTENVTNGHNGQFFTPEPVCDLMAQLTAGKEPVEYKTVLDPAVGSGRLLMSFAKQNPMNRFYGADASNLCAQMTVLNMFLNGMQGEVAHMNSLSMSWYSGWEVNMNGLGIEPIEKERSRVWKSPEARKPPAPSRGQLILF